MKTNDFKDLLIWQKSMDLTEQIYTKVVSCLPHEERFGLGDQLRRCSVSIPSNIAEGHARNSNKEFIHFLSISRGSVAELQTQLILCQRLLYINEEISYPLISLSKEIDKMIFSLMKTLSNRLDHPL